MFELHKLYTTKGLLGKVANDFSNSISLEEELDILADGTYSEAVAAFFIKNIDRYVLNK